MVAPAADGGRFIMLSKPIHRASRKNQVDLDALKRQAWLARRGARARHIVPLERRALLSAGFLDTTFDGDGIALDDRFEVRESVQTALLGDGKLLSLTRGPTVNLDEQFWEVSRYLSDGSLDNTFGSGGRTRIDMGAERPFARDIVVQPDGKILAVGFRHDGDVHVARLTSSGQLDTSFDGDGRASVALPESLTLSAAALTPAGKLVLAGHASSPTGSGTFAAAQLNANGTLDTTFGSGGMTTIDFGPTTIGRDVAVQSDGRIVLAGNTFVGDPTWNSDFAVARLTATGALDTTFSGDGKVTNDLTGFEETGNAVVVQTDGKIVVGGHGPGSILARYNANGTLDGTFDGDGLVRVGDGGPIFAMTLLTDGRIVTAGTLGTYGFSVARFTTAGAQDTTFDGDGHAEIDMGGNDFPHSIAARPDGRIVVAGNS